MRSFIGCVSGLLLPALAACLLLADAAAASPADIAFSTYLGGSSEDVVEALAVDAEGNVYVTGWTWSLDFPATLVPPNPPDPIDAFVAKLDPEGRVVFSVLLGGSLPDRGVGIALGPGGDIWVAGVTGSPDFPRTDGSPAPVSQDVFVARLAPDGTAILSSTVVGGSGWDDPTTFALDGRGRPIVAGRTESRDFPLAHALFSSLRGRNDGFVLALEPDGAGLEYSTYLGGSDQDSVFGVAADAEGFVHVTGHTFSWDFPVASARQASYGGNGDVFVARLAPAGDALVYSTFLGSFLSEEGRAIAVGEDGDAWVTGLTTSPSFPTVSPLQPALRGGADAFLARLDPTGALVYSSFFGGSGEDWGLAIDAGAAGVHIAGRTHSVDLPLADPVQAGCAGPSCEGDAFLAGFGSEGRPLALSTYLGGGDPVPGSTTSFDSAVGVGLDHQGGVYLAGLTITADFPTVSADQPEHGGGLRDGFIARIVANASPDCSAAFANPALLWPANGKLRPVSIRGVTDPEGDPVALRATAIHQDEPLSKKGQPDATGLGTATPMLRADRAGSGDGRVYHIAFEATDPAGAACTGTVTVCVPHDRGRPVCGDGGPLVDSTGTP